MHAANDWSAQPVRPDLRRHGDDLVLVMDALLAARSVAGVVRVLEFDALSHNQLFRPSRG